MDVIVTMKDGTKREFKDYGRSGGSYSQQIRYETAFLVIVDAYGEQTAIPVADIKEARTSRT